MVIPKKLKIGGHVFKVEVINKRQELDTEENCGITDVKRNLIVIDGTQTESQQEETLIHEIFHALNGTMNHEFLHSLAHGFHQVLRDNKLLK